MTIRISITLHCDGCDSLAVLPADTNFKDARREAAGRGWTTTGTLDHCPACTRERAQTLLLVDDGFPPRRDATHNDDQKTP